MRITFAELASRKPPEPWAIDRIPWDHPGFSERMLAEHLSQDHDRASRRDETIARQVEWLVQFLPESGGCVVDLGCGPGLHMAALARAGHHCTGIDISPASLRYARDQAVSLGLQIDYRDGDVREIDLPIAQDLVYMLFGEFNTFARDDAARIASRCRDALRDGGRFVLELSHPERIQAIGTSPARWWTAQESVFSALPHVVLEEFAWDEQSQAATHRWYVIEGSGPSVYGETLRAWAVDEVFAELRPHGFEPDRSMASHAGDGSFYVVARRILSR
jgi:SAM-dependent methyltransferase